MLRRMLLPAVAVIVVMLSARGAGVAYGVQPINFTRGTVTGAGFLLTAPTVVQMGPDGRLYVAQGDGKVQALTLDPVTKQVTAVQQVASSNALQEVYGIAFDPTDTSSPPTVYVTNTVAGLPPDPTNPSTFPGKVTRISGPTYATRTDIITGLPISKTAHEANDLAFGPDGRLYIEQGSATNAGIINPAPNPGFPLFLYPDTPLSGAILVADIKAAGFNGNITYSPVDATNPNIVKTGGDVSVYASGFRNPYGLVFHSNGKLYATDNGPNAGYGGVSTTCTNPSVGDAFGLDELDLVEAGKYYGHANRNRGAAGDARQCVFHYGTEPSTVDYTAPIEANLPASSDGMVEYTSGKFGGQMQGDLLYAAWVDSELHRVRLSADGLSVVSDTTLATGLQNALAVATEPDGTIYVAEYGANKVTFLKPNESAVSSITITAITPAAGPIAGGQTVSITGTNFTTAADTTVRTLGGQALTNVVVQNSTTMTAVTPASPSVGFKGLTITNSVGTATLASAYNYVAGGGAVPPFANAGANISSPVSHENHGHVTLDGSGSSDSDGFIANYAWTEGPTVVASGTANKVVAELTQGEHVVTLTVTDNDGLTSTDTVQVNITTGPANPSQYFCPDVNGDRTVDSIDQLLVAKAANKRFGVPGYERMRDPNADRIINSIDGLIMSQRLTRGHRCPIEDVMARTATLAIEKYQNINQAIADGYTQATQFVPQQGRHMTKQSLLDTTFDPAVPEGLLYEPDSKTPGGWRLGGAFYIMPIQLNPLVPDGFPGTTDDAWHYHDFLCFYGGTVTLDDEATCTSRGGSYQTNVGWLLHLWNYVLAPYGPGRYVEDNPNFVGLP